MGFFQHSHAVNINGGDFSDVHGDQNNYNYANTFQMHGQNISTTVVNGNYHNGPKNSISNQAGGDIHVYGQGDGCAVMMGPVGFPFLVNQPNSTQRTPSPSGPSLKTGYGQNCARSPVTSNTGYHQGGNNGIINNAGTMQIIGQGQNSSVQIGYNGPLPHSYMSPNNGMYPHYPGYNSGYRNAPQPLSPFPTQYGAPFQHGTRSQPSPYPVDFTESSSNYLPPFPQQAPTPNVLSPPRSYERSPSPMGFQTTNYTSDNNSYYTRDSIPPNRTGGSNPPASVTSSFVNARVSHAPGAYASAQPIPSPSLEPVTPVPLAHPIPSAPAPGPPPAPPTFQNVPTVNAPFSVPVLAHAQGSNVPFDNTPPTHPLMPTAFPPPLMPELGGSLQFEKVQVPPPHSTFSTKRSDPAELKPTTPPYIPPTNHRLSSTHPDTSNTEATSQTVYSTIDLPTKNEASSPQSFPVIEAPSKIETTSGEISPKTGPLKRKKKLCPFLSWVFKKF